VIVQDLSFAIDVKAHSAVEEIKEDHADVWVFKDVADGGHHSVATVFRVSERLVIEDVNKPGKTKAEGAIAFAVSVRSGNEDHLLARDEFSHQRVEAIEHLFVLKCQRPAGGAIFFLRLVFAFGAGKFHVTVGGLLRNDGARNA
jgi:hypothetical protein